MNRNTHLQSRALRLAIAVALMGGAAPAHAATKNWDCVDGNWADTSCWSTNSLPTAADDAHIDPVIDQLGGVYDTVVRFDSTTGNQFVNGLYIDSDSDATVSFLQSGGSLVAAAEVIGTGSMVLSGGSNTVNTLSLNSLDGGVGSLTLTGSGELTALASEYVGYSGIGSVRHDSGTNTTSELVLGNDTGSSGSYVLSDLGVLSVLGNEYVGNQGLSVFAQTGGRHSVSGYLYLGSLVTAIGEYALSGGGLTVAHERIGNFGSGSFTQSGGVHNVTSLLVLGNNGGGDGSYSLSGTGLLMANAEYIGYNGSGEFSQSGGTHEVTNDLVLGFNAGGVGTYTLDDGTLSIGGNLGDGAGTSTFNYNGGTLDVAGSSITLDTFNIANAKLSSVGFTLGSGKTLTVGTETIGNSGAGLLTQTGGVHTIASYLYLGRNDGFGSGAYELTGGSLTVVHERIGDGLGTDGSFTQSGGTHSVGSLLVLGNNSSSHGTYALSGGTLSVATEYVGYDGIGSFTQSGGTHTVEHDLVLGFNPGGSGLYTLTGGMLEVGEDIVNNANGVFNTGAGTSVKLGGVFSNHGALNGAGTVIGTVVSDGSINPGSSPGTLSIDGDYTQTLAGTLAIEISGLTAGMEYDVLNITGTASLDGSLEVSLFDLGGGLFAPQAGDSFDILTAEVILGGFSALDYAVLLDPNLMWDISYLTDAIGTTDIVRLSVVSAVPVPAAAWLLGSGLLGLIGASRRGRS